VPVPRPSQKSDKRRALLPILAATFAELGYRRTTTAALAGRCGVQENVLYRLWPDKKAMFIAAIAHVYDLSIEIWRRLLATSDGRTPAERLLEHEAEHHGELGLYRIVFAGLSETDDPEIRAALADMYERFYRFVHQQVAAHQAQRRGAAPPIAGLAAWAFVGLGTVANIGRELGLLSDRQRRRLVAQIGRVLLEASAA
jgi:AcrR family transcriptional regulator